MTQEKELNNDLKRYYYLVNVFEQITIAVENEMHTSTQWFSFGAKLARKQVGHHKSFVFNVTQDLIKLEIDDIQISNFLDISVLYTVLRVQFDTYATFYHLFVHEGEWDEKIIRFRLWQMDSLLCRQKFSIIDSLENERQKIFERKEIAEMYSIISSIDFFRSLPQGKKERLLRFDNDTIKSANWKFDKSLLSGKKQTYSWKDLSLNTGIKSEIYRDMHDFTSMHVHSNYISLLQNEQLTLNDKHAIRMVCLRLSCYLMCMFMDDLCNRFTSAKMMAESLSSQQKDLISGYLKTGRLIEKIKYFT